MIDLIKASVGRNAKNDKSDVYIVQEVLNLYALEYDSISTLTVDGKSGPDTEKAIYAFQKSVAKLRLPDSKIDNGGKTERIMAENMDAARLKHVVEKYRPTSSAPLASFPATIRYGSNVLPEVSQYSENIIKLAMKFAKVSTVMISSSRRTISDQARIMYDNCSRYNVSNVSALKQVRGWGYGPTGMAVEEVYFANKSKPQAEVLAVSVDYDRTELSASDLLRAKATLKYQGDAPTYQVIVDLNLFNTMAGLVFAGFIEALERDDAETAYSNAPNDLKRYAYDALASRYREQFDQEAADTGRNFDRVFPEPEGMAEHRAMMKRLQDEQSQRQLDIQQK